MSAATDTAASGSLIVDAGTSSTPGQLVQSVYASGLVTVSGSDNGRATASIGDPAPTLTGGYDALAAITGAPTAGIWSVTSVNPDIQAAFGADPSIFAIGQMGGRHAAAGSAEQTISDELDVTVDLTQLTSRQDLVLGLYGLVGNQAIADPTLNVDVNGASVFYRQSPTLSGELSLFEDDAVDLGSLASNAVGDTLRLQITFSFEASSPDQAMNFGVIVGDSTASTQRFAQAASSFASGGGGPGTAPAITSAAATPVIASPTA